MSKITFVVIAVLVFIASVCGTDEAKLESAMAKKVQEKVKAIKKLESGVKVASVLEGIQTALKTELKEKSESVKMVEKIVKKLQDNEKAMEDLPGLQKAMTDLVEAAEKEEKKSGASQSVPSMIAAAVVVVVIFMN